MSNIPQIIGLKASRENQWYGVEWDINNSDPAVKRIGDMGMHRALPIHNKIKGCLLNDDGGINYYLNPTDWTKQLNGSSSNLDGTDGMVMVEKPKFYNQFQSVSDKRRIKISPFDIQGFKLSKRQFVSAYEAALNRTNNKLASVVNTSADYRGGNNNAAWDAQANSLLGKPASYISRTNFRTYARNRGSNSWNILTFLAHNALYWLFIIEYATRNSQAAVNHELTAEGYKQGGLGDAVTTANSTEWSNFNSYYPFINCGASNSIGNGSGEVEVVVSDFGGVGVDRTFTANRYRGVENPFGHIWENCDGINIKIQADGDGGESQVWITDNILAFNDSDYNGFENIGLLSRSNGYFSKAIFGEKGILLPNIATGSSSIYYCDYFYTSIPGSGESLRTLLVGGSAHHGSSAGFVSSASYASPAYAHAYIGSRLTFI